MKKFENVTFIGGRAYSEPLTLKSRSATYIFIILLDPADEYLCPGEVRRKSKVGIFFYS